MGGLGRDTKGNADVCQAVAGDCAKCRVSRQHRCNGGCRLQTIENAKWKRPKRRLDRSNRFERFTASRKNNRIIWFRWLESIVCVLYRPILLFFSWYLNEFQRAFLRLFVFSIGTRVLTVDQVVGMYSNLRSHLEDIYVSLAIGPHSDYYCVQHVFISISIVSSV